MTKQQHSRSSLATAISMRSPALFISTLFGFGVRRPDDVRFARVRAAAWNRDSAADHGVTDAAPARLNLIVLTGGLVAIGAFFMLWLRSLDGAAVVAEPGVVGQWARAFLVLLPLMALAVFAGLRLASAVLGEVGRSHRRNRQIVSAAAIGMCAAWAISGATVLYSTFFGARVSELAAPAALMRGFFVSLPIALLAAAIMLAVSDHVRAVATPRHFGAVLTSVLAATLIVGSSWPAMDVAGAKGGANPIPGNGSVSPLVPVSTDPGSPCPSDAPQKSFDVTALSLRITLNRFGDNDPNGLMYALTSKVAAIRTQEAARTVTPGLRDDPIQPLIIRANEGDCVKIKFRNSITTGSYGVQIDGLSFDVGSAGGAVGLNPNTTTAAGQVRDYTYYIPVDDTLEGAHYLHPGPGNRNQVAHGLFGTLVVEPQGSTYWNSNTANTPITSGWEATIVPAGKPSFRENVQLYHEYGNESEDIFNAAGNKLPTIDPHTGGYRPGSRLINYRSEPFMNRLNGPGQSAKHEALAYSSYTFGDPATVIPRGYLGDPTKFRILHAGSELFHVFHMHGGGIRWRLNPHADPTYDYTNTGLNKYPVVDAESERLDSQSFGPGESYDLQIEGGAGGVQQGAGEFLFHCHIASHYVSGMWGFWRVYNTLQPDFVPLPDRPLPPTAVTSAGLIGKTFNGTTITAANLDSWIKPQLPPKGVRIDDLDPTVWDWSVYNSTPTTPTYLGEPEDQTAWPDYNRFITGHPTAYRGDTYIGNRPVLLFDPLNGRPAFPLMRPHVGKRPPFSPNGHSGAPYLGETGDQPATPTLNPWQARPDGICPAGAPVRKFNVTGIDIPVPVTPKESDPNGMVFTLAKNADKVRTGQMPIEPLAIRANIGDCVAVTLTSQQSDANQFGGYAKLNMHIHHVQFDTQASDGVITGMSFEQAVRPYATEDSPLSVATAPGATSVTVDSIKPRDRVGIGFAVGEGTDSIEVRTITAVNPATRVITLDRPLDNSHAAGEYAGTEFVQYRWYPDVDLDNIFWHDHTDGIHNWGHGLVGQLIVEPKGSTYHDPVTGAEVDSGTIVDIRTNNALAPSVPGSFREMALWTIDENPVSDATLNLRAAPFNERNGNSSDDSQVFSSYKWGDPGTPMPRAYPGDNVVIRTINVGPSQDTLHLDGHQVYLENRYPNGPDGRAEATPTNTLHYGVSEKYTLILKGGAGGPSHRPGDYLYMNGIGRYVRDGAWGIIRVLNGQVPSLQPLPGSSPAPGGSVPTVNGVNVPSAPVTNPCPPGAPNHDIAVSAVDLPLLGPLAPSKVLAAFVPTADANAVIAGTKVPEPLVMHVAAGECVHVQFTNRRTVRASFHADGLDRDVSSSGINVGYNPENTVAPGGNRDYYLFADDPHTKSGSISDFGTEDSAKLGLYGLVTVAKPGSLFTNAITGQATDVGSQVIVHEPDGHTYRDWSMVLSDDDPSIGQNHMPYPIAAAGPVLVNYQTAAGRATDANQFSSYVYGDPKTPTFKAYAGDETVVHALGTPGSEQVHAFSLGGHSWSFDDGITNAQKIQTRGVGPWEVMDAKLDGGAGGLNKTVGDFAYSDNRRAFTDGGMWGLIRTLPVNASCPIIGLSGACASATPVPGPTITGITPGSGTAGTSVTITGTNFTGLTNVNFNGANAVVNSSSDTQITTTVPLAATSGAIWVTAPGGSASSSSFTVIGGPQITSVSPNIGTPGTSVTITGTGFTDASSLTFNGTNALFSVLDSTSITTTVPAGATSGLISVTTPVGAANSPSIFTVPTPPTITSFTPSNGQVGTAVTITGTGFTGATVVKFKTTNATFTVVNSTTITTTVPAGATNGAISVTTPGGTATSATNFPVLAPSVTSFTPTSGAAGTVVAITGGGFAGVSAVRFNGVNASAFTVVSSTKINATVPASVTTGKITVVTSSGTATSAGNFG